MTTGTIAPIGIHSKAVSAPISRRRALVSVFSAIAATASGLQDARAEDTTLKVGALRLASAGPLYFALHEGYFKEEGLIIDVRYFDAAQPIALAVTGGDLDLGVTAMTAGFFNIAGKGALKVVAGQAAIVRGRPGDVLMASNKAYESGLRTPAQLPGHSIAVTQVGSSFHYELGLFADAAGFNLQSVTIRPLQSVANMMAALKGGQVDGAIVSPQAAVELTAAGEAKAIGRVSDAGDYRFGAVFASTRVLSQKRDAVSRFIRAYRKGASDYNDAFFGSGRRRADVAYAIAEHIMPGEPKNERTLKLVTDGAYYVDANAPLDKADMEKQLNWFKAGGFVEKDITADKVIDASFAP